MFHPATLLVAWVESALILPLLSLPLLTLLLLAVGIAASVLARARACAMLKRTRWLLLSVGVLFAFATPGLSAPAPLGQLGVTLDGLLLAAEHLARLLLLLLALALLHERLGTAGLISGLHRLLALARVPHDARERIVVRLMLVIDFVDGAKGAGHWRDWLGGSDAGPERAELEARPFRRRDWLALAALLAAGAGALAW